jgi:V-type H+-transporting ATPase subunit a
MMYGDIGHGTLLFCAGLCMVWFGPKLKYSVPMVHWARYVFVQMGFFAIFAGFMYNDLFGIVSLPLFESRFTETEPGHFEPASHFNAQNVPEKNSDFMTAPFDSGPYPFGLDPAWHGTANELLFVNNLKMKLSVLVGVLQMILGVGLRFANSIHDNNMVDFFFECVPMLIFMVCFFGYMDYMIVYKWTHVIGGNCENNQECEVGSFNGGAGPPGIINSLICMAMHQVDKQPLWEGAQGDSSVLMLFTVIAVPWILGPKPFILRCQHNAKQKKKAGADVAVADDEDEEAGGHGGHGHGGEFEFGEIMIHQIIETIEYVLGTVSHTASYLRIWALSLAHQQLSVVFYTKTVQMGFASAAGNPFVGAVVLFFLFGGWFGVTVGVLLMMDVLECALHTLRLHWVEFQSKFYKHDGYLFTPFNIKKVITADK